MIAGDRSGKIYLSSAQIVTDTDPISVSISGSSDVAPNTSTDFTANIKSGVANTIATWKVDDGSAPVKGSTFTHQFAKSGVYHVEVSVIDADGMKKAATASYTVTAQDQ